MAYDVKSIYQQLCCPHLILKALGVRHVIGRVEIIYENPGDLPQSDEEFESQMKRLLPVVSLKRIVFSKETSQKKGTSGESSKETSEEGKVIFSFSESGGQKREPGEPLADVSIRFEDMLKVSDEKKRMLAMKATTMSLEKRMDTFTEILSLPLEDLRGYNFEELYKKIHDVCVYTKASGSREEKRMLLELLESKLREMEDEGSKKRMKDLFLPTKMLSDG